MGANLAQAGLALGFWRRGTKAVALPSPRIILTLSRPGFCDLQRLKTLVETRHSFQGDLIALVQVVAPLFIDTPEAVSTRVASSIYPVPDLWTWLRLSGADHDKPVQSQSFNRFVEKGLCVTPQGQAEVAHQANCIRNTL